MTYPYADCDAQTALIESARSWIGTPFVAKASVKGSGVDCVHLALALYTESGFPLQIDLPEYGLFDGACRRPDDAGPVTDWLRHSRRFEKVWPSEYGLNMRCGDLLAFRLGDAVHHLGVALGGLVFGLWKSSDGNCTHGSTSSASELVSAAPTR